MSACARRAETHRENLALQRIVDAIEVAKEQLHRAERLDASVVVTVRGEDAKHDLQCRGGGE